MRPLSSAVLVADPVESLRYPIRELRRDHYGTWWAPGAMGPGVTYSVVSDLLDHTPATLRQAIGAELVEPEDLDLRGVSDRVRALAQQVAGRERGRYARVMALTGYLQSRFRYTLELERVPAGLDPVDWFLFDRRAGYCEQFATAATLMLRAFVLWLPMIPGFFILRRESGHLLTNRRKHDR